MEDAPKGLERRFNALEGAQSNLSGYRYRDGRAVGLNRPDREERSPIHLRCRVNPSGHHVRMLYPMVMGWRWADLLRSKTP